MLISRRLFVGILLIIEAHEILDLLDGLFSALLFDLGADFHNSIEMSFIYKTYFDIYKTYWNLLNKICIYIWYD